MTKKEQAAYDLGREDGWDLGYAAGTREARNVIRTARDVHEAVSRITRLLAGAQEPRLRRVQ